MIKRFVLGMLACLMLTGCSSKSKDLENTLTQICEKNLNGTPATTNHSKKYLKYYVPKNIGVLEQDVTSTVFKYENTQFLMSINVASIVSDGSFSYRSPLDLSNAYFYKEGSFIDCNGEELMYNLSLVPLDGRYYIILNSTYLSFYGYSNAIESIEVVNAMTKILKSASLIKDKLIANFDRDERQKSEKIALDLFNEVIPSSGRLQDIVSGEIVETPTPLPTEQPVESEDPLATVAPTPENLGDIYQEQGDIAPVNQE